MRIFPSPKYEVTFLPAIAMMQLTNNASVPTSLIMLQFKNLGKAIVENVLCKKSISLFLKVKYFTWPWIHVVFEILQDSNVAFSISMLNVKIPPILDFFTVIFSIFFFFPE